MKRHSRMVAELWVVDKATYYARTQYPGPNVQTWTGYLECLDQALGVWLEELL